VIYRGKRGTASRPGQHFLLAKASLLTEKIPFCREGWGRRKVGTQDLRHSKVPSEKNIRVKNRGEGGPRGAHEVEGKKVRQRLGQGCLINNFQQAQPKGGRKWSWRKGLESFRTQWKKHKKAHLALFAKEELNFKQGGFQSSGEPVLQKRGFL